jgi:hypothetical protein
MEFRGQDTLLVKICISLSYYVHYSLGEANNLIFPNSIFLSFYMVMPKAHTSEALLNADEFSRTWGKSQHFTLSKQPTFDPKQKANILPAK